MHDIGGEARSELTPLVNPGQNIACGKTHRQQKNPDSCQRTGGEGHGTTSRLCGRYTLFVGD